MEPKIMSYARNVSDGKNRLELFPETRVRKIPPDPDRTLIKFKVVIAVGSKSDNLHILESAAISPKEVEDFRLAQASRIMKSDIERNIFSAKRSYCTSGSMLLLQDDDFFPISGKQGAGR